MTGFMSVSGCVQYLHTLVSIEALREFYLTRIPIGTRTNIHLKEIITGLGKYSPLLLWYQRKTCNATLHAQTAIPQEQALQSVTNQNEQVPVFKNQWSTVLTIWIREHLTQYPSIEGQTYGVNKTTYKALNLKYHSRRQ